MTLIKREDAIETVHKHFTDALNDLPTATDENGYVIYKDTTSVNELLKHNKAVSKAIKALPSAEAETVGCTDFIRWLTETVMDEVTWELNAVAYGEVIARKLTKLGVLEVKDGYYIRPSADAVQVVRCGECKHMIPDGRCMEFADDGIRPSATDFCSYGERREDGEA